MVALHAWKGVSYGFLTRDPAATMHEAPYLGVLSQLGLALWAAAATAALVHRAWLPRDGPHDGLRRFLLASAALTLLLGADDAFQLHEYVLPRAGIDERLVMLAWAALFAAWLGAFHRTIRDTDYTLLAIALACFGLSSGIDQFVPHGDELQLLEEGTKFLGLCAWVGYFWGVGR